MLFTTDCVRVPAILAVARLELTLRVYGSAGKIQKTGRPPQSGDSQPGRRPESAPLTYRYVCRCVLVQGRPINPGPGTSPPIVIVDITVAKPQPRHEIKSEHCSL